jgi:alpha-mannosidase
MGYRQLRLLEGETPQSKSVAKAEGNILENDFLKVQFTTNGTLGVLDKETGKEVFTGGKNGCRAVIIDDPSDTWSHDIKSYPDETGAFGNAAIRVLENGPLRATTRVVTTYHDSTLTIDWSLCSSSRNLEAKVTLDWHEHLRMLKFSFPVDVESSVATYETPYGHIERLTNGYEDPGQRWIDLSGQRGQISGLCTS